MIPNYLEHVKAAKDRYPEAWRHAHVDGDPLKREWIKLLAADLHAIDARVGCNGKRGNPNDLSMDALNVLDPDDGPGRTPDGKRCWVVDVIGGAGGPTPQPIWNAFDDPGASSGAWVKPGPAITLMPPTLPDRPPDRPTALPKGEAYAALRALNAFYQAPEGLQRPGGLVRPDDHGRSVADMEAIAQWFYQLVIERVSLEDVFTQIRASHEYRQKHGLL